MKLLDMHGKSQRYPFALGHFGRGRYEEEVRVDQRNPPAADSDDVGYHTFVVGERKHTVITAPSGQRGVLVRVNTEGVYYTKGSNGSCQLIAGTADMLARGAWAYGLAGRCGGGPDALYHVVDAAIFRVVLSGGEGKGLGARYTFIDGARGYVRTCRPYDAVQDIVTDEDPVLSDLVRRFADALPEDLTEALEAGSRMATTEIPGRSSGGLGCS
jgi:hypothetical protein